MIDRLLVMSHGIRRLPSLRGFLPEVQGLCPQIFGLPLGTFDAVAGWGHKPTADRARAMAARRGVPYVALEDGFLRSLGLGAVGVPPLSLVVDQRGIYYDATGPSDIEHMLQHEDFGETFRARAKTAMDWLVHDRLTKYNTETVPLSAGFRPLRRLIVDQTAGDASVILSGAGEDAFTRMIDDALSSFEAADVAVKLHPDTMAGRRGGYLRDLAKTHGLRLIDTPVCGWDLLSQVDEVATISSQFGMDALMAGKKVHCYGLPFYAGWGLTEDSLPAPRRGRKRDAVDVFAAAYLRYARYVDPYTGSPATLEDTVGLIGDLRRHRERGRGASVTVAFSPWKRNFVPHFSGPRTRFAACVKKARAGERIVVWSSRLEKLRAKNCLPETPTDVTRMEDGFVRSRGLGAKLVRPWSLVLDSRGIYYDPRQPSDLEHILQNAEMPDGLLARAENIRRLMVDRAVSKYNTGEKPPDGLRGDDGQTVVLVPGQVEDDASILTGTEGPVRTNLELLRAVRAACPDARILYKPHPDVEAGKRKGVVDPASLCDLVVREASIAQMWPFIDEVHTMTSLAGFEGLLRGKKVKVYGKPFYAGWGLTDDKLSFPRRSRKLTLNQLVAGTLVLYPLYFDWKTRWPCNIETVIRRLAP